MVDRWDKYWYDIWYDPIDQSVVLRISVSSGSISDFSFLSLTSVSSYHLIAVWIAFGVIFSE